MNRQAAPISLILASLAACDGGKGEDTGAPDTGLCRDEGGVCVLSGTYTEDATLTADRTWKLRSFVDIGGDGAPVTLTIEPGTLVYGESASDGVLVIHQGARLVAEGTADAPIVFTSDQPAGRRDRGDWGGVVVNGLAPVQGCDRDGCLLEGEDGTGAYGGPDPDDDSGVLRYVRIAFAGSEISSDNNINGLSLWGVGRGTTVDHVQVHMAKDDGVELLGGAVDLRHLLVTGHGDDAIDWESGWQGRGQFIAVQQHADDGESGFEGDNNGDDPTAEPTSHPVLSHLSLIGAPDAEDDSLGALLRRGTAGELYNVAMLGWNEACYAVRDEQTYDHLASGGLALSGAVLGCAAPFEEGDEDDDTLDETDVFDAGDNALADPALRDPYNLLAPDLRPSPESPLLSLEEVALEDSFFEVTGFRGAFGEDDWTAGWTDFEAD